MSHHRKTDLSDDKLEGDIAWNQLHTLIDSLRKVQTQLALNYSLYIVAQARVVKFLDMCLFSMIHVNRDLQATVFRNYNKMINIHSLVLNSH